jgi:hypothetical protein
VGACPAALLELWRKLDENPSYEAYEPTPEQKALFLGYLDGLPAGMRAAFRERLIGIYFIKNLLGNGLTDFVLDDKDPNAPSRAVIILNPAGFDRTLSETLTLRERSVFKGEAAVSIDCGTRYKGILYSLLHEGTHAYDFIRGITPYPDGAWARARELKPPKERWDVWEGFAKPGPGGASKWWSRLKFYGAGGGPLIEAADAPKVYEDLLRSPFASLYSTLSWGEDAAELMVFYHVTQTLGQSCAIKVPGPQGSPERSFEPMEAPAILGRAKRIYDAL